MILSDKTIKTILRNLVDLGSSENVSIEDLHKQINPNSIDLTIGSTYKRPVKSAQQWVYGFRHQKEAEKYAADCRKKLLLIRTISQEAGCSSVMVSIVIARENG